MGEGPNMFEELYGFLPVPTDELGSSLFLLIVYGFILLRGANLLSDGSEMLLEIFPPGIIGGIVLPVLGALPDCLIIVVSGMGPREEAIEQVKVGLGTLAGSTVMLLTIAWGGSVLLGQCDLEPSRTRENQLVAKNKTLSRPFDMVTTGVTADETTKVNAMIMTATTLLYFVVHIPALAGVTKDPMDYPSHKIPSIVGFVCCMVTLVVYISFQMMYPGMRRRILKKRTAAAHLRAVTHLDSLTKGRLVKPNGQVDDKVASDIFRRFDLDSSGHIEKHELKTLLMGMTVGLPNVTADAEIEKWMKELDKDSTVGVSEEEFITGLKRMVASNKAVYQRGEMSPEATDAHLAVAVDSSAGAMLTSSLLPDLEEEDDDDEEELLHKPSKSQIMLEACLKLAAGAFIAAAFADPMVGTVTAFATASNIPAFFVAFVVTPLASNASELVSSLTFAMKKKKKNISLTFSQIYGAVTMNNTLCLGLFLFVVFMQQLTWNYTAEVTAIVIPTIIVGCIGLSATTFRTYVALIVLPLYLVGICIVLIFQEFFPNIN
eukprot:evm.model.scf_925.3 EVM.evm.TU.scf_925.3   scf_925:25438-32167(+)